MYMYHQKVGNMDDEFISKRRGELDEYFECLAKDPVLLRHHVVLSFLSKSDE